MNKIEKWYQKSGSNPDVVISSRIRLARNLSNYPFCNRFTREQTENLLREVKGSLANINLGENKLTYLSGNELTGYRGMALAENHMISPDFLEGKGERMLVLSEDQSISIMVNEEDHIRIQVMASGLALSSALEIANQLDDVMDERLSYAFDEQLGYLTACPSNLGTGLRASVMLHLPALEKAGALNRLSGTLSKLGLTLRGTYGEGTKAIGGIYQISNQITLGLSEEQAVQNLQQIVTQIIEKEREARKALTTSEQFEDRFYRCYGTLKYARLLSSEEAYELISHLKIGVSQDGFGEAELNKLTPQQLNSLLFRIGGATLCEKAGKELTPTERDRFRAKLIQHSMVSSI